MSSCDKTNFIRGLDYNGLHKKNLPNLQKRIYRPESLKEK